MRAGVRRFSNTRNINSSLSNTYKDKGNHNNSNISYLYSSDISNMSNISNISKNNGIKPKSQANLSGLGFRDYVPQLVFWRTLRLQTIERPPVL